MKETAKKIVTGLFVALVVILVFVIGRSIYSEWQSNRQWEQKLQDSAGYANDFIDGIENARDIFD